MSFGVLELSAAVHQFLADSLPGRTCKRLIIVTHQDDEPISLPMPALSEAAPAAEQADRERVSDAIIAVLKAVGHNLTTTRLLSELAARGKEWSERTVSGALAKMVDDGTLFNERVKKPRGYGLPEWGEP